MPNYTTYKGFQDETADRTVLLDSRGARKTETLFLESISSKSKERYEPIYTLRENDKDDKPSAYQIYMHSVDETDAALKLVGSLSHWRRLCGLKWFMEGSEQMGHEGILQWREDMRSRDASRAKQQLLDQAASGSTPATKKIYEDSTKRSVGRPRKDRGEYQEQQRQNNKIESIHKRLFGEKSESDGTT